MNYLCLEHIFMVPKMFEPLEFYYILISGFARVGAMCDLDSASVVEDHGGFQSINTAAHELGHRYDVRA